MQQNNSLIKLAAILWVLQIFSYAIGYNAFLRPLFEGDILANIHPAKSSYVTGMLMEFLAGPCFLAYTVILLPYFKKVSEPLANWYFGFRIIEFAVVIFSTICLLTLMSLSEQYVQDPTSVLQAVGEGFYLAIEWSMAVLIFTFAVNSFALAWLFLQSKIIPSWLAILLFVVAGVALFGQVSKFYGTDYLDAVILPIVVWELITALWLIIKGVDTSHLEKTELK